MEKMTLVRFALLLITLNASMLAIDLFDVLLGLNFHCVDRGKLYRCAQPSTAQLARVVCEHNIRTVVNLRGHNPEHQWYEDEKQALVELGVTMHDVNFFSANEIPNRKILLRIIHLLDNASKPVLIHCHGGADRSGLVSAIYLLLQDCDLNTARGQLSINYGYIGSGYKVRMLYVLDNYESWLQQERFSHNRERFCCWAKQIYDPPAELTYQMP